ncbi:unnamed protein product, partial [marine sediment metagenome]
RPEFALRHLLRQEQQFYLLDVVLAWGRMEEF